MHLYVVAWLHSLLYIHNVGHYYFFNVETKTSAWSLDANVIGVVSQAEAKSAEDNRQAESKTQEGLPQIQNLNLRGGAAKKSMGMMIDVDDDGSKGGGGSGNKPGSKPVTPASPIHPWQKEGFKCGSSLDGKDGASYNKRQYLTTSANTPTGQSTPGPPSGGVSPLPENSFKRVKTTYINLFIFKTSTCDMFIYG